MVYQDILSEALRLSPSDKNRLIEKLTEYRDMTDVGMRKEWFFNKQVACPYCQGKNYSRWGKDKGSQRFKCKDCGKTFTEFTGTWLDGIHKKSLVTTYLELMLEGKSLDTISKKMKINKKTAFDWRHKILSSLNQDNGEDMEGIVESDETFFEQSEKGSKKLKRSPRKRGSSAKDKKKRGISSNKISVIVTADRKGSLNMCVASRGRIKKSNILLSLETPLKNDTVLCTDGHVSYKGFALDNDLKHVVLRSDLKEFVKQKVYHIQNVNSLHHRLKKWIDGRFWGVSTKYLQNYLGWFRLKEQIGNDPNRFQRFIEQSLRDSHALKKFQYIEFSHQMLLSTHL